MFPSFTLLHCQGCCVNNGWHLPSTKETDTHLWGAAVLIAWRNHLPQRKIVRELGSTLGTKHRGMAADRKDTVRCPIQTKIAVAGTGARAKQAKTITTAKIGKSQSNTESSIAFVMFC